MIVIEAPATPSAVPTFTPAPPTLAPPPTATPLPAHITQREGVEMFLIPAGEFIQGSEGGFPDEAPVRTVYLDDFYLDRLEVSNAQYRECVGAEACQPPRRIDCCTEQPGAYVAWPDYFTDEAFNDYPVIFISWYDARDFCEWRGARLATEAEWEKASRGRDGRIYPWGNEPPTPDRLNFTWLPEEFTQRPLYTTAPVDSYPEGASPYGVLNLAGNVYEWVQDVYDRDYYVYAPDRNPPGPSEEDGTYRVTRGGSFFNQAFRNRSANRNNAFIPAESFHFDGGARCALDTPQ
ncbi:MAG: SUMF1/EgtB/PvdO family nonheme iron enzyme [Anaerolineae bacterium]|nr:SUMF1/EgtB/PvdO family nonheme iron enzyme [Anaerolineae bacterium]